LKKTSVSGGDVLKKQTTLGLAIMLVGIVFVLYGVYWALTTEHVEANIRILVSRGFSAIIVGIIVLINGVVVQGYKNYHALTIHLLANIPYAVAIWSIFNMGYQASPPTDPQEYIMATFIYWIIGAILNVGGIVANRFAKEKTPTAKTT
jgi:hypothetical protein